MAAMSELRALLSELRNMESNGKAERAKSVRASIARARADVESEATAIESAANSAAGDEALEMKNRARALRAELNEVAPAPGATDTRESAPRETARDRRPRAE